MAVLSVDTAIVHIAVGLEKPLVAIYPRHGETFSQWLPTSTPPGPDPCLAALA